MKFQYVMEKRFLTYVIIVRNKIIVREIFVDKKNFIIKDKKNVVIGVLMGIIALESVLGGSALIMKNMETEEMYAMQSSMHLERTRIIKDYMEHLDNCNNNDMKNENDAITGMRYDEENNIGSKKKIKKIM